MLMLLIDSHYLMWRAYYTTGRLSYEGEPTGTIFGFLRDVLMLRNRFMTDNLVFCLDSPVRKRKEVNPMYKYARDNRYIAPEEKVRINDMRKQMKVMVNEILPGMGYVNLFRSEGYEADDLIAKVCEDYLDQEIIIVSGDSDLFQLLKKGVCIFNPRDSKLTTSRTFKQMYGITPEQWVLVKAMAGDEPDSVHGIKGIGQKTAIKWLQDKISIHSWAGRVITSKPNQKIIQDNIKMIKLPYEGTPFLEIQEQPEIEERKWKDVMYKYGIKSLTGRV